MLEPVAKLKPGAKAKTTAIAHRMPRARLNLCLRRFIITGMNVPG